MKLRFESLSGFSFDDVRVHYNSGKPAQLQALAYAQGTQVHIAPGQEKHLEHELRHVVQQKEGRVKPSGSLNGTPVNDDPALEREADGFGCRTTKRMAAPADAKPLAAYETGKTAQMMVCCANYPNCRCRFQRGKEKKSTDDEVFGEGPMKALYKAHHIPLGDSEPRSLDSVALRGSLSGNNLGSKWQAHHIIPVGQYDKHNLRTTGLNFDAAWNGIMLPAQNGYDASNMTGVSHWAYVSHCGSHPGYDTKVETKLNSDFSATNVQDVAADIQSTLEDEQTLPVNKDISNLPAINTIAI